MGSVIVVFRIIPKPEQFDKVKAVLEGMKPERLEEEPIAFGLKALKFTKLVPDSAGSVEKLEKKLESVEGVSSIENVMTSRSL
jgi:elongation factor 1-beta